MCDWGGAFDKHDEHELLDMLRLEIDGLYRDLAEKVKEIKRGQGS